MNVLKTLTVIASAVAVTAAGPDAKPQNGNGGDAGVVDPDQQRKNDAAARKGQEEEYGLETAVVTALKTCLKAQKNDAQAACKSGNCLDDAKTFCKTESVVNQKFTAWGTQKKARQAELIDDMYMTDPRVTNSFTQFYDKDADEYDDAEIATSIGASGSAQDIAAAVLTDRMKKGQTEWFGKVPKKVKDCRTGAADAAAKTACLTGDVVTNLCTKTKSAKGTQSKSAIACCNTGSCTAIDAEAAIERVADNKLSADTKACAEAFTGAKADRKAELETCMAPKNEAYKEATGVDLTDPSGKLQREEKLVKLAEDAVGDAVRGCMGKISKCAGVSDADLLKACKASAKAARTNCAGGQEAITTMATRLGVDQEDITATAANKYAQQGAKDAAVNIMKTFVGTYTEKLAAAKKGMAERGGKTTGTFLRSFVVVF